MKYQRKYKDRYIGEQLEFRSPNYYRMRLSMLMEKLDLKMYGKILDVGCGDGGLSKEISNTFPDAKVYGIDISKKGCKMAKKFCYETKVADLNKRIPYRSNTFDYIVSQEVLEHILDTDNYFLEVNRVLKKGGRAIITTPNLLAWYQRIFCLFGILPTYYELSYYDRTLGLGILNRILAKTQPVGHIRVFTSRALKDIAVLYEFKVLVLAGAPVQYNFPMLIKQLYNILDFIFSKSPSLASNLVLYVEKK